MPSPADRQLSVPPNLPLLLATGALTSPGKRGPYEGARLPETRLVLSDAPVDAKALRAYTQVCGFPTAAQLPPTYPHILGFPLAMRLMADRGFPFPLLGLVHTEIGLTQHRALHTADRPEIAVHAEGLDPHRKGSQFAVVTEAYLGGETVWESRSTYLCRHRTDSAPEERTAPKPPDPLPVRATWELPGGLGRRYAAASGDRNPIHLHPLTAKLFGFPRHIAHGMWTFARCLAEAGPPERFTARAEFKAPVLLPGTVTYGERDGAFELRGAGSDGRLHLSGTLVTGKPAASGRP